MMIHKTGRRCIRYWSRSQAEGQSHNAPVSEMLANVCLSKFPHPEMHLQLVSIRFLIFQISNSKNGFAEHTRKGTFKCI